jgi:predicted DNA repair protein MutK
MELKVVLPICMCVWFVVGGGHAFIAGAYHELSQKTIKDQNWVEAKKRLDKWSAIHSAISRPIMCFSIGLLIGSIINTLIK